MFPLRLARKYKFVLWGSGGFGGNGKPGGTATCGFTGDVCEGDGWKYRSLPIVGISTLEGWVTPVCVCTTGGGNEEAMANRDGFENADDLLSKMFVSALEVFVHVTGTAVTKSEL